MRLDLAMPWSRPAGLYSVPGQLILKLELGEAPEGIPAAVDVRRGAAQAAERIDGGPVDRILSAFTDGFRASRVHAAAAGLDRPGAAHLGFDDLEQSTGVARTLRIETAAACQIGQLADALRQLAVVEAVSPQYLSALPFTAAPPSVPLDAWAARRQIGAPAAMAYEPGDPAVIVGVIDTGVASGHVELRQRLRPGYDAVQLGSHDVAAGIELLGDRECPDVDPEDEVGHGTSCAAIIAANGEAMPPGLAGGCSLLPVRVLGSARLPGHRQVVGLGALSDIDEGVKMAIDLGAAVLNLSFGTPSGALAPQDPAPHADLVSYARHRRCVLVAASGNSGTVERFYPAAHEGVIAVGSVGENGRPSAFSTRGEHVALCAPGERVLSAGLQGYQRATGTSFAAPFVTATAALLVSRARRRSQPLSGDEITSILRRSARPWPTGQAEEGHGAGTLDVLAALRLLDRRIDNLQTQNVGPRRPLAKEANHG